MWDHRQANHGFTPAGGTFPVLTETTISTQPSEGSLVSRLNDLWRLDRFPQHQSEVNAAVRDDWRRFRRHREKISELLQIGQVSAFSRLCVLGAGKCNDLDLMTLLNDYGEVHLVDLDREAIFQGVLRQGFNNDPRIRQHGGVDLTGMLGALGGWSARTAITDQELNETIEAPMRRVGVALGGPFERVASTCLLTQLIGSVVKTAGEGNPRFIEAVKAIRLGHLRLMAHLLAPGGTGVLITDVVSSDSLPTLASFSEEVLPALLVRLIRDHNFFHGVNPVMLAHCFRSDPVIAPQVNRLEFVRPWLWDFGPRVYAVFAVTFRKAREQKM